MHTQRSLFLSCIFACWLLFFHAPHSFAQTRAPSFRFQHLGVEDGMSDVFVSDILQDESGFIWIGTQYGLNRFDGYEFLPFTYDADDTLSLAANWVETIDLDTSGNLWLGTWGGGLHRFDLRTQHIERHPQAQSLKGTPISNRIAVVDQGLDGKVWMATPEGLAQFDPDKGRFFYFPLAFRAQFSSLNTLCVDRSGFLWLGNSKGVARIPIPKQGEQFLLPPSSVTYFNQLRGVKHIHLDRAGNAWVAGQNDLALIPHGEDSARLFAHDPLDPHSLRSGKALSVYRDGSGRVWIGFDSGLDLFLPEKGLFYHYNFDPENPASINRGSINKVFEDRQGNLWLGTSTGISMLAPYSEQFEYGDYPPAVREHVVAREILKTPTHIWLGGGQLLRYDLRTRHMDTLIRELTQSLVHDPELGVWAGTRSGLTLLEESSGRLHPFSKALQAAAQNPKAVYIAMAQDHRGRIWMGTSIGLWVFEAEKRQFRRVLLKESAARKNATEYVLALSISPDQTLWVGTSGQGVFSFDLEQSFDEVDQPLWKQHYEYDPQNPQSLSNNVVIALEHDLEGSIWAGTDGGLSRLDPATGKVTRYLRKHGLEDDKIMDVMRDHLGMLWVSTLNHGLYKVEPGKGVVAHYGLRDGLRSGSFLYSSAFRAADSTLWFGNLGGINVFRPDQVSSEQVAGQICFTELWMNHQRVRPNSEASISEDIPFLKQLKITPEIHTVSLKFAVLDPAQSNKIKYAYFLKGYHDAWQMLGSKREVIFSNLPPGSYSLQVRATEMFDPQAPADWTGATAELSIRVIPPWWRTTGAKVAYVLLTLLIVTLIFRFRLKRKLTQAENERLRELNQLRNRLYTNISHEFRTPLTIIQGVSQQVLEHPDQYSLEELQEKLSLMGRNGEQMLHLVNQMLELSRLEAGAVSPAYHTGNLASWMRVQLDAFEPIAKAKGLSLHFQSTDEPFQVLFAPEALGRIIGNLLSNAVKFTPENGQIVLHLARVSAGKREQFRISVKDTGIGIPADQLPFIFDRFYQVDHPKRKAGEGTGIGLSLCQELVTLLKGRIEAHSRAGEGTEFVMHFPLRMGKPNEDLLAGGEMENRQSVAYLRQAGANGEADQAISVDSSQHRILVVEDNADVQHFIGSVLEDDYVLLRAQDGLEGLEIALEEVPDLILSDVVMPGKDGLELLQELKNDYRTSHIPVILLTAKASVEDRLEGLGKGADSYLAKPFLPKELQVRISNLIQQRQLLQQKYQQWISASTGSETTAPPSSLPENSFLTRVLKTIEAHYTDPELDVSRLCQLVGMSRSQLHKKLKALTGYSTTHFVRSIRLEKAKQMLESQPELTVAEVAYAVGFKDPNYFTRNFSNAFGLPPSQWKSNH